MADLPSLGKVAEPTASETAGYVGRIAGELRGMAVGPEQGFLAYLLSMVEEEALATVRRLSNK